MNYNIEWRSGQTGVRLKGSLGHDEVLWEQKLSFLDDFWGQKSSHIEGFWAENVYRVIMHYVMMQKILFKHFGWYDSVDLFLI